MHFYTTKARTSKDPIVGLLQLAASDPFTDKIVAIIGSATYDDGSLIVPEAVLKTVDEIVKEKVDIMSYAPNIGLKGLDKALIHEVLGKEILSRLKSMNVYDESVVTAGGTSAISVALIACTDLDDPILTHNPHWAGYDSIALGISRKNIVNFDILDLNGDFNFVSFENALSGLVTSKKIVILLNTPFDNPLGKDFGKEVWNEIANILRRQIDKAKNNGNDIEILIILDTAYVDFGPGGKDYSRLNFVPHLFSQICQDNNKSNPNFDVIIASTVSKSLAMYGARVGAATLLSTDEEKIALWKDTAGGVIRGTYSNGSRMSQEIALRVLGDPGKLASVHAFQESTVQLISKRKEAFINYIKDKLDSSIQPVRADGGFFLSLKISDKQFARQLINQCVEDHYYIPLISDQFLRIPICGLSEAVLEKIAEKIIERKSNLNRYHMS